MRKRGETGIERKIKGLLLSWGVPFIQEKSFPGIFRGMVDFYLPTSNQVIECDGDYFHNKLGAKEKDAARDASLVMHGIRVLRLPESQINKDWEAVLTKVHSFVVG